MNMKEIAKLANVSVATVSYTLNGTGNVSEKKRKEIMEIVKREGYQPNRIAKSLRTKKSNTVGVLVEDITSFQTPRIINGINSYMEKRGYAVILNDMGLLKKINGVIGKGEEYKSIVEKSMKVFEKTQIDGLIYVAMHDRDIAGLFAEPNIPFVMVYCYNTEKSQYYITYDNKEISREIGNYLIDKGHTKLGMIQGAKDSLPARLRYEGYTEALQEAGITMKPEWIFSGDWEFKDGEQAYEKYKLLSDKPTAIFGANDLMAMGFIDAALNDKINIPEAVSIIGFDNRQECMFTRPRLTTVDIPLERMGTEAGRVLLDLVERRKILTGKIVLPSKFVENKSVYRIAKEDNV